jgi:hypothetical protein
MPLDGAIERRGESACVGAPRENRRNRKLQGLRLCTKSLQ